MSIQPFQLLDVAVSFNGHAHKHSLIYSLLLSCSLYHPNVSFDFRWFSRRSALPSLTPTFCNNFMSVLYAIYMTSFAAFDLFFYLEASEYLPKHSRRELFSLIMMGLIVIVSIIIFITFLVMFIIDIVRSLKQYCQRHFK